jgi:hypothetical protein
MEHGAEPLRARLLELEPMRTDERARYESALRELFDRRLGPWGRLRYLLPALGGLVVALGLGSLALTEPASTPDSTRALLGALALLGAAWFVLCARILRRGSVNVLRDGRALSALALACATLQALVFGWRAASDPAAVPALVLGLVFVVLASVVLLAQRIRESELRVREQLLRAQLDASHRS